MTMAAAVAPSAVAVPEPHGISHAEQQLADLVKKLTTLRNDIVAGSHPRLKLPAHIGDQGRPLSAVGGVNASSLPGLSTGAPRPVPPFGSALPQLPPATTYPTSQDGHHVPSQHASNPATSTSGINPIFLEKSDTLVKAEAQVKRERLEHALEEQAQMKKTSMKHKTHDEFAMPDFSIDVVLKGAQELVQPMAFRRDGPANGGASSADSFDENTFYSSQMNESTSTEGEVIEEPKRLVRPKLCRFYLNNKPCPYGDGCQFSHDPAMRARVDGSGSYAKDMDGSNVGEETSSRLHKSPPRLMPTKGKEGRNDHSNTEPTSQQQRIAQLEAELQAMKEKEFQYSHHQRQTTHPARFQDTSGHPVVGPDEFGRDTSLRDHNAERIHEVQQQDLHASREYRRNDRNVTPPSANNVRVIRNHITSPYAPQPARVSPLAVAKVSQVHQNQAEANRTSRIAFAEVISDGSPNVSTQPLNSRKRRRGRDSGEHNRNVAPRQDSSPQIRVKEEPVSPPLLHQTQPRRFAGQDTARPLYIDAAPRSQERTMHQTRVPDRPRSVYEAAPLGPPVRRVISRNGQRYLANDEPDLRRIVSERQMRVPVSPAPRHAPYPDTEPRVLRASSQAYISHTGQRTPFEYRASIQPQTTTYGHSPSPPMRQVQSSPLGPPSGVMAPPSRRVMVDQYSNRFFEPEVRQISVAPITRPPMQTEYDQYGDRVTEQRYASVAPQVERRYEQQPSRVEVLRSAYDNEESAPHFVRRPMSPASPQYMEHTRPVQVIERRDKIPGEYSYAGQYPNSRVFYRESRPDLTYEQSNGQREGTHRVQSVRPVEDRYEQISRVQSVQPQPRIVQLAERQPMSPPTNRHASVRPGDGYPRPESYGGAPQGQYAPSEGLNGGFYQEVPEDTIYEAPRRIVQRM